MKISEKKSGDIDIIEVEGSIDSKTAPDLQQSAMSIISESNNVVLDITNVTFVSSAGLRVLLMVYRNLKAKNGKVVLVGVSEEIQEVMHMTGFINFFEISPTLAEGLAKF